MAFSLNYWQITASHVQHNPQRQPKSQPKAAGADLSQVPQMPVGNNGPVTQPQPEVKTMPSQPIRRRTEGSGEPSMADKVVDMMQTSPNLTMAHMKAILQIDRFN